MPTKRINYKYFDFVKKIIVKNQIAKKAIDLDFMRLVKFIRSFDLGMKGEYSGDGNMDINLPEMRFSREFQNRENPYGQVNKEVLRHLAWHLALTNRFDKSMEVLNVFADGYYRRNTIIDITYGLQTKGPVQNSFEYLNLLFDDIEAGESFGIKLVKVLSMIGSQRLYDLSFSLIKNLDPSRKARAMENLISGVAYNGYYYKAYKYIPDYVSSNDELKLYNEILHVDILRARAEKMNDRTYSAHWRSFDKSNYMDDVWLDYESHASGGTTRIIVYED